MGFLTAAIKNNLNMEKTAMLGKRTKFQIKSTAQLIIILNSKYGKVFKNELFSSMPISLILEDDMLLDSIQLDKYKKDSYLSPFDQCILLGICSSSQNLNSNVDFSQDEQNVY